MGRKKPSARRAQMRREKRRAKRGQRRTKDLESRSTRSNDVPAVAWATFEEALGGPVTPHSLVEGARRFSWSSTIEALAGVAAESAVNPVAVQDRLVRELNGFYSTNGLPDREKLMRYVNGPARNRTILHERSIHFLQQMMLLHGAEEEAAPEPRIYELALMGLMANDHLLRAQPTVGLDYLDIAFADSSHLSLFNQQPDHNTILRLAGLFGRREPRLRNPAWKRIHWPEFLRQAFGTSFEEHYYELVLPIFMWSLSVWGHPVDGERIGSPFIDTANWASQTGIGEQPLARYLDRITVDRGSARSELEGFLDDAGLPRASSLFFHKPLVRTREHVLTAASPGVFWQHLRTSLWSDCRIAANSVFPKSGSKIWLTTFGDLFEDWIRHVTELARDSPDREPRTVLTIPAEPGTDDEIEDVVVVRNDKVALISVKTAMIRGELPKEGDDRHGIIQWWKKFLFAQSHGGTAGAIRLLDTKIRALRTGAYEPIVGRKLVVYPALVMYDELGANPAAARWIRRECAREGLLTGADVRALAPATVEDFELLMTIVAGGGNIFDVLGETNHQSDARVRSAVARYASRQSTPPFTALRQETDEVMNTMKQRLFQSAR